MIQLVYLSQAVGLPTDDDLIAILNVSRVNNDRDGLTGALLYRNGAFLQVLEGESEAVEGCLERILRDSRHTRIVPLFKGRAQERAFPDWRMGFLNAEGLPPEDLPGLTRYLEERPLVSPLTGDHRLVERMLMAFRTSTRGPRK